MAKIVQIGQQQRCGGTLLLRTLGNHPQLAVNPNECYFSYPYKYHPPFFESNWVAGDIWKHNFDPGLREFRGYGYDIASHRGLFCNAEHLPSSRRDVIEHYLETVFRSMPCFERAKNPNGYVFFSPRRTLWIDELAKSGELDVMIQVLRHPLGYFASAYHHNRYYNSYVAKLIWRVHFFAGLYFANRIEQLLLVKFEDLVKSPEVVLRSICRALELPFSTALLMPKHDGREWHGDSSFGRLQGIAGETSNHYRNHLAPQLQREWSREVGLYEEYLESSETLGGTEAFMSRHGKLVDAVLEYLSHYKHARPIATNMFISGLSTSLLGRIVELECTDEIYCGLEILARDETCLLFEDGELNSQADLKTGTGHYLPVAQLLRLEPRLRGALIVAYAREGGQQWRQFNEEMPEVGEKRELFEDVKLALQVDSRGVNIATLYRLALSNVGSPSYCLQHLYAAGRKKISNHFEAHTSWHSAAFHLPGKAVQKLLREMSRRTF